ncbi:toxin-antitoxin system YwqK family antitoxin [Flammeovirga sp. SJP92]|uniref:toxin-antitoxin system YwqK family antitoxin n=1 Tax=Flammeovirga sp. SJP92 TaxID=1775430 RepID=UPI0007874746|nr:hypothetical protein [Flammeovirga sp. SJP92]KXX69735.1 hypothetical protein AVL50_12645 [Flammeovirga sp. SJP92]
MKFNYCLLISLLFCVFACDTPQESKEDEIVKASPYSNEIKEGLHVYNYDNSKKKRAEINYTKGVKDGLSKTYYKSGKLKQEINYVMGKKEGVSKMYHTNGTLYKEAFYENNEIKTRKYFYKDGELKSIASYENSKPTTDLKEYYKSGKLKTKYPAIMVKEKDDTALHNKVTLEVTLSEKRKNVSFYIADDINTKVKSINPSKYKLRPVKMLDQKGIVEINIPKGYGVNKKIQIISEYTTIGGRKKIDSKIYNLSISNK